MGLLPGVQKVKKQIADAGVDDRMIKRQEAIIGSMTKLERRKPDVLNASRKRRVAAGAGVEVQEINRLLKQHRQMSDVVKSMSRGGGKGFARMAGALAGMGIGGADSERLRAMGAGKPPPQSGLPGLGGAPANPPGGLPGLGGGFPFKKP